MALLRVLHYPDPALSKKAVVVDKFDSGLKSFIKDMMETMCEESGVGLAAPQVGVSSRIILVDTSAGNKENRMPLLTMINPKILEEQGVCSMEEGCLSLPDINVEVKRAEKITVTFMNDKGEEHLMEFEDLSARIILHEIDHLDGLTILDRVNKIKGDFYKRQLRKRYKKECAR